MGIVVLIVYMDDIMLIERDTNGIPIVKKHYEDQFMLKNLGKPYYFWELRLLIDLIVPFSGKKK